MVELRRYVHHLEAERDEERKEREAILEARTNFDAGHRGTAIHVQERFVEKKGETG